MRFTKQNTGARRSPPSSAAAAAAAIARTHNDPIICGQMTKHEEFIMDSGCQGDDCNRTYFMYVPSIACRYAPASGKVSKSMPRLGLPVVFVAHCFGCTAESMYKGQPWISAAEKFDFVAVFPEGKDKSWNAVNCCGAAIDRQIDDAAFFRRLMDSLMARVEDRDRHGKFHFLSKKAHYATGWSNGGFLVTHLASVDPTLFRAIAPTSGFVNIDEVYKDQPLNPAPSSPVAILMNHASDDPTVRFDGCCTNSSMPQCCCRISDAAHHAPVRCMSGNQFIQSWAVQRNECQTGSKSSPGGSQSTAVSRYDEELQLSCTTYTDKCHANTTLCVHGTGGHLGPPGKPRRRMTDMVEEIAHFFADDACTNVGGGRWFREKAKCVCPGTDGSGHKTHKARHKYKHGENRLVSSPYCAYRNSEDSVGQVKVGMEEVPDQTAVDMLSEENESWLLVQIASVVLLVALVFIYRRFCQRGETKAAKPVKSNKRRKKKQRARTNQ